MGPRRKPFLQDIQLCAGSRWVLVSLQLQARCGCLVVSTARRRLRQESARFQRQEDGTLGQGPFTVAG